MTGPAAPPPDGPPVFLPEPPSRPDPAAPEQQPEPRQPPAPPPPLPDRRPGRKVPTLVVLAGLLVVSALTDSPIPFVIGLVWWYLIRRRGG